MIWLPQNYRSHYAILMPPSAIFYNDSLIAAARNGTVSWSGLPCPTLPLVFFGLDSREECINEVNTFALRPLLNYLNAVLQRATWYNNAEISKTVEIIISLLSESGTCSPALKPRDIGVMAPWRQQVWNIRERLREKKLRDVDVGTIEVSRRLHECVLFLASFAQDYQGRESRVVIISCVRSTARFLMDDFKRGNGVFFERRR
jgi:superfamily I DNA and/or RNA helicase